MRAAATSADQNPLPSLVSGVALSFHALKVPATHTESANFAHTRKAVPPPKGFAPMPGCTEALMWSSRVMPQLYIVLRFGPSPGRRGSDGSAAGLRRAATP